MWRGACMSEESGHGVVARIERCRAGQQRYARRSKLAGFAGFALGKVLSLIEVGRLVIELPSGARLERVGARPGPHAEVKLNNWRALRRLFLNGDVGRRESLFRQ